MILCYPIMMVVIFAMKSKIKLRTYHYMKPYIFMSDKINLRPIKHLRAILYVRPKNKLRTNNILRSKIRGVSQFLLEVQIGYTRHDKIEAQTHHSSRASLEALDSHTSYIPNWSPI